MNNIMKVGFGLAIAAGTVFAAGCAEHSPAFQCGRVDYKSMASCKGMATTTMPARRAHCKAAHCKGMYCKAHGNM